MATFSSSLSLRRDLCGYLVVVGYANVDDTHRVHRRDLWEESSRDEEGSLLVVVRRIYRVSLAVGIVCVYHEERVPGIASQVGFVLLVQWETLSAVLEVILHGRLDVERIVVEILVWLCNCPYHLYL